MNNVTHLNQRIDYTAKTARRNTDRSFEKPDITDEEETIVSTRDMLKRGVVGLSRHQENLKREMFFDMRRHLPDAAIY
ncbi:hypothetical protein JW758_06285 [Candidatus Peregrinibacteria bacterium]|nr:hypothetical protein [Candidatus Peregrinibacteria bacterium]